MTHAPFATLCNFTADPKKCIACGLCATDCPARIITIENGRARVAPEDMEKCLACQHCLAICPTAAASVAGKRPENSEPVHFGSPADLSLLMRSRRSVRQFAPGVVERPLVEQLLRAAAHAPTGVNIRERRFTVVHDAKTLTAIRDRSARLLVENAAKLPEEIAWLTNAAEKWLEKGRDIIFRNAPHILVVTSGPRASTPKADCLIALSYFELIAQANGIATVWCGMVDFLLEHLPETRALFNIPGDHTIGYAMLFGRPAISYRRTAQYEPEAVEWM